MIPPGRCCFGAVLQMEAAAAALRLCNQPWRPDLFIALRLLGSPYVSAAVFYWLAGPFHRPTRSCAHAAAVCLPLAAALAKSGAAVSMLHAAVFCCVCLCVFACTLLPFIHLSFSFLVSLNGSCMLSWSLRLAALCLSD